MKFHGEALQREEELLSGHLKEISIQGLSHPLSELVSGPKRSWDSDTYAEVMANLAWLLDEVRFSGAFAGLLIQDQASFAADGRNSDIETDSPPVGMPIEVVAMLHPYFGPLPPPSRLFDNPHTGMAGARTLSLWFAGQMIDSSLFRLVSALDRLATALWCLSGTPLPRRRRDSAISHPAFIKGDLARIPSVFDPDPWGKLVDLVDHPLYALLKRMRDGFTHYRRSYSGLHGFSQVTYGTVGTTGGFCTLQGMDGPQHLAVLLGTYDLVLRPAIELSSACVASFKARPPAPT